MSPHPKIQKDVSTTLHTLLRPLLKRTLPFSPFTYRNQKFATSFTHCFFHKMVPKTVYTKSRFIYKNHLKWRRIFSLEKKYKKEQKITFLVYQWVKKPAQKPLFFVPKSCTSTRKIASKSFIYTPGINFFWTFFPTQKITQKYWKNTML